MITTNKEPVMIDKTKTYTTSHGELVVIYRTDAGGDSPVHGAVLSEGHWIKATWQADGTAVSSEGRFIAPWNSHSLSLFEFCRVLPVKKITEGEGL